MYKISNALVFDDKINLLVQEEEMPLSDIAEYHNLRTIHEFFLLNAIPYSIISDLAISPSEAIEKIKLVPKPDIVVLDLDLNSSGDIENEDIELLSLILKTLKSQFGEFIILIYSTLSNQWQVVKSELLDLDNSLSDLLITENVIVAGKQENLNTLFSQNLKTEIEIKRVRYFDQQIKYINNTFKAKWNKEITMIFFLIATLMTIIFFAFNGTNKVVFWSAIIIMIIATLAFISINSNNDNDEKNS